MSQRDPQALAQLSTALGPAAARLQAAAAAAATQQVLAATVRSMPGTAAWLAVVVVAVGVVTPVPFWLPPLVAVSLAMVTFQRLRSRIAPAPRGLEDGAYACDRAHANHDRLTAACELAGAEPPTAAGAAAGLGEALAQAAIDDGVQSLRRVDPQHLALPASAASPRFVPAILCVLGLALLPWLLPHPPSAAPATEPVAAAAPGGHPAAAPRRDGPAAERAAGELVEPRRTENPAERKPAAPRAGTPPPPKPSEPAPAVPAASGQGQSGSDAAGDSTQSGKPKQAPAGSPGTGQSGGGQGAAASGAPEPQPSEQPPKAAPPKPKKPQPQKEQPQQDGKPSESAGAPSGPSRGSGRLSAVGNKRTDLNRGQEREDDPEVEDEPVEDESEEQEQRGGVMPMRRGDNRPAARELSISGDGPPDAGRGGPTPPKKARGTASLVLGLRLPDSVRGQPNPGTAKTSLEQIPPRPSFAEAGLARPVAAGRPTTPQSSRRPSSFLSLQQAYSALLRAQDAAPPPASANPPANPPADSPKDRR